MKNADDAIELVLTGLREVEAPVGMERRIVAAMEDRASSPARAGAGAGWRWPLWLVAAARPAVVRYVVMGCGAAGVIALVLATPGMSRFLRAPSRGSGSMVEKQVSPLPLRQAQGSVEMTASEAGRNDGWRASRLDSSFGKNVVEKQVSPLRSASVEMTTSRQGRDGESDAVAMSETRAASFPAPPMPLTEQERLLLRMLHRGEPVELAMLDPQMREMQDAKEKAEFQQFFAKPVVKDSAADGAVPGQAEAGAAQSSVVPVADVAPAAEGVSPAAGATEQSAPEKTAPIVANPEPPSVKDGFPQQITTVEKD